MRHLRQILATVAKEMPSSAARNRDDQCVIPASRCGGLPLLTRVAATTSISSTSASLPLYAARLPAPGSRRAL